MPTNKKPVPRKSAVVKTLEGSTVTAPMQPDTLPAETPPHRLFVSYAYTTKDGASGFAASTLNTPFEDITSQEDLHMVLASIQKMAGHPVITIMFWKQLASVEI